MNGYPLENTTLLGAPEIVDARGYEESRLADALYWFAQADAERPLTREQLDLALAGGLLGELVLAGKVAFWDGGDGGLFDRLVVVDPVAPDEAISAYLYGQILSAPTTTVARWLMAVRDIALASVAQRLGLQAEAVTSRRRLRRGTNSTNTYAPPDGGAPPAWSVYSLRILRREPLSAADGFLIGVGMATGLHTRLMEAATRSVAEHAERAVRDLPWTVGQLVAHIQTVAAKDATRPPG